jgi:hypothetical protein
MHHVEVLTSHTYGMLGAYLSATDKPAKHSTTSTSEVALLTQLQWPLHGEGRAAFGGNHV